MGEGVGPSREGPAPKLKVLALISGNITQYDEYEPRS